MIIKAKNSGTAIITVILIVAIVSITAITMQGYLRSEINRTQMIIDSDELYNNLLSIESWGLAIISKLSQNPDQNLKLETINNNINLYGLVINQGNLFNINYLNNNKVCQLSEPDSQQKIINKIFIDLLILTNNEKNKLTVEQATDITKNIQGWTCPQNPSPEDIPASGDSTVWSYQAAGQLFTDISELRLVNGMTKEIYENIKNFITAIPASANNNSLFNLDSISPEVFAAIAQTDLASSMQFLNTNKTIAKAEQLNAAVGYIRARNVYQNQELDIIKNLISASSNAQSSFYIIKSNVSKNDYMMSMQTLVTGGTDIKLIWRKRG
ncbi:MAG: general secretion pathway protein GspK [Gammaproteobacteria bacterium]|nr:general secretion pathway protein GspK [Gammaproteobacteria bacterium]